MSSPRSPSSSRSPALSPSTADTPDDPSDPASLSLAAEVLDRDFTHLTRQNIIGPYLILRRRQRKYHEREYYDAADHVEQCLREAYAHLNLTTGQSMTNARVDEITDQLAVTREDLDYLRQHWREVLRSAADRRDADLEALEAEHAAELEAFDEAVRAELPVHYRKLSPTLLQMRGRQFAMCSSKRYAEAKLVKDEADALEKRENAVNWDRWLKRADADKRSLMKRQQEKLFVRRATWRREIYEMERIAEREILHCLRSVEHLEGKICEKEQFAVCVGWVHPEETKTQSTGTAHGRSLDPTEYGQNFKQKRAINKLVYSPLFRPKLPKTAR